MYKYIKDFLLFFRFLLINRKRYSDTPLIKKNVGVLVTDWSVHTVKYYNISVALLIRSLGYSPVLVYDDLDCCKSIKGFFVNIETFILLKLLGGIRVVNLSSLDYMTINDVDRNELSGLSKINTYYKEKTTVPGVNTATINQRIAGELIEVAGKINRLFSLGLIENIIVPGGVYGRSGLYIYFGKKYNVRVATYDSGYGVIIVGTDDVAGYLKDIPKVVLEISDLDKFDNEISIARSEFEKRMQGKDFWQYQSIPFDKANDSEEFDVVIPLNVEIDTASLVRSSHFGSMYYWLTETVDFLLKNTQARIAIKEHPSVYNRTGHLKDSVKHLVDGNPRVAYYSRNDKINTYKLLGRAKIVLPYTSTVGIEAAIMGKTVIVESGVYYSGLPFVVNSVSKSDYFNNILRFLQKSRLLSDDEKNSALLCYYVTQKCNFLNTYFTAQPVDFAVWVRKSVQELLNDENIKMILSSFVDGIPLAKLNHDKYIRNYNDNQAS